MLGQLGDGCSAVVTGDFNSGEGSDPYRALFGESESGSSPVVDSYRVAHPEPGADEGTFSSFRAETSRGDRIDWIAVSRDWRVLAAAIDRTGRDGRTPSDHFPVTAILDR